MQLMNDKRHLTGGSQHTYSGLGHHIACCAPLLLLPAQAHLLGSCQRILVQGGQMHIGAGHRGLVGRRGSHHTVNAKPLTGGNGAKLVTLLRQPLGKGIFLDGTLNKSRRLCVQLIAFFFGRFAARFAMRQPVWCWAQRLLLFAPARQRHPVAWPGLRTGGGRSGVLR